MKTKAQKKEQLEKGKELLAGARSLVFADFGSLTAEQTRKLRRDLKNTSSEMHVIKKRILSLIFKGKGLPAGSSSNLSAEAFLPSETSAKGGATTSEGISFKEYKVPVAAIFSKAALEEVSGTVYRFFKELSAKGGPLPAGQGKLEKEKILGGYEAGGDRFVPASEVVSLGQLPSREVLLSQLVGMIASPLRSFMFVLSEKSKQSQ
jgi:ribosomal protein L10